MFVFVVRGTPKIGRRGQMKRLKWFLALSVLVAVGCAVQVKEITKPARLKSVRGRVRGRCDFYGFSFRF